MDMSTRSNPTKAPKALEVQHSMIGLLQWCASTIPWLELYQSMRRRYIYIIRRRSKHVLMQPILVQIFLSMRMTLGNLKHHFRRCCANSWRRILSPALLKLESAMSRCTWNSTWTFFQKTGPSLLAPHPTLCTKLHYQEAILSFVNSSRRLCFYCQTIFIF